MVIGLRNQIVLISLSVLIVSLLLIASNVVYAKDRRLREYGGDCVYRDEDGTLTTKTHVAYDIYSDPPGAHVYGDDGAYWGKTSEDSPLTRWWSGWKEKPFKYTITLKKRGYKQTKHTWTIYLQCQSKRDALNEPDKIVVVLDIE